MRIKKIPNKYKTNKNFSLLFLYFFLMAATAFLSMIIFMAISLIPECFGDPRTDIVARMCANVHVKNVSNYFNSYSTITDYMEDEMYRNKFAYKSVGNPPDRLYVLAQCQNDLSNEECSMCFSQTSSLIPGCFPNTGGRVYLDGCFIRADNYSFYREAIGPLDTKRCSLEVNPGQAFRNAIQDLLDELSSNAPSNQGFAVSQSTSNDVSVYGVAICWKTLDQDLCSTCLSDAASDALSCLPSVEARVLNAGCFLRYSNYPFANNSGNQSKDGVLSYISYFMGVIMICFSAICIGVCVGKFTYQRMNRLKKLKGMEVDLIIDEGLQFLQFKYSTLETATENFNNSRRLGSGGFGEVYRGTLADGREIAVKRLFVSRKSQLREICNEMDIISRAQHKNLVRFLGCCFTRIDSFLVYEYLANKSLNLTLFDPAKKKELDWKKRLQIITGTAEGLEYLHKDSQIRIIHRDIKASNILLDLKHKPKISDFGLARFYSCDQSIITSGIVGTLGYMAPEYIAKGRLTEKVDVYSFGVLVIEIVTGVENTKYQSEEIYESLITSAWNHFKSNRVRDIIDRSLDIKDIEEIRRVVQIGLLCTQESPNSRPTMTSVVQMLRQKNTELPTPSKPPFTDEYMELNSISSGRLRPDTRDFRTP